MKLLTIISGLPGSGKTTLAHTIAVYPTGNAAVCEADSFFYVDGVYKFDPSKLGVAHQICQDKVENLMRKGGPVIVSNTSLSLKEILPYQLLAAQYGYKIQWIGIFSSPFESLHNIPEYTFERMKTKFSGLLNEIAKLIKGN